jgi:uncharacterized membrane protein YgdD (TMEM256/DUF423 family)
MKSNTILVIAALLGALTVGLGAFGAHALKAILIANGRLETYELAVRYQFYHVLALLAIGLLSEKIRGLATAAVLMITGMIIFSGSLYILSLANQPMWGAVTPVGGVALIAGWLAFAWAMYRQNR